jgi:hypothetical protein
MHGFQTPNSKKTQKIMTKATKSKQQGFFPQQEGCQG